MSRRRLLTIAHSYVVGTNRRLAHELARAGGDRWEVTAVAPRSFRGDLGPLALALGPDDDACRVVGVPAHATVSPHAFLYGGALRKLLAQPWDVVHCWEEPFTLAGGQVAWWTPEGVRLVYATFQNISKTYPFPFSLVERYAMSRAAGWGAFGHTVAETLGTRPLYRDRRSATIPPGVDVERFRPDRARGLEARRALGWDAATNVVGYLGRFVAEKGIEDLLAALERTKAEWRALFVGGGPLEPRLRAFEARHRERVRIVGGVRHDQVPIYLNAMDVLCAPSRTTPGWREQFGRMLIEAFACGVPVVASDSGEIPHVVGDAGALVRERDPDALARALGELLASPALRADLSARGLARAHERYAWSHVGKLWVAFLDSLLEETA